MSKSKRWCFTVNNPQTWRPTFSPTSMSYLVWEMEVSPTTWTQHVQGYVRYKVRKMLRSAQAEIHPSAHMEIAKGSEEENMRYCSKDRPTAGEDWGEEGEYAATEGVQGRRTDLDAVADAIQQQVPLREIARTFPKQWIRFHAGIENLARTTGPEPPLRRSVTTTVLWGATGTGKTHRIRNAYPNVYMVKAGRDPWAGYIRQEVICFDEFDPEKWTLQEMNMFLDVWPCNLDSRYFNKDAFWTKVFILSNTNPDTWYPFDRPYLEAAFKRRLTYIVEILNREQELLLL